MKIYLIFLLFNIGVVHATGKNVDFDYYGFTDVEYPSKAARKGLQNILTGKSLPFPVPLSFLKAGSFFSKNKSEYDKWVQDGTIKNPIIKESNFFVDVGSAIYTDRNGKKLVTSTCFACHSGNVAGTVVAGLGNGHFDTAIAYRGLKKLTSLTETVKGSNILSNIYQQVKDVDGVEYLSDFLAYAENIFLPPMKNGTVRGDNHGAFAVWFAGARLSNPQSSGIKLSLDTEPQILDVLNGKLPNIDPLPWWNIKFKKRAYWFWDAPGHSAQAFNMNFYTYQNEINDEVSEEQHLINMENKIKVIEESLDFARSTHSPRYPRKLDNNKIERGMKIYNGETLTKQGKLNCVKCHGTYTPTPNSNYTKWNVDYPNLDLADIGDVGTDPSYNSTLQVMAPVARELNKSKEYYDDLYKRLGRDKKEVAPFSYEIKTAGYAAPVLVGLWASAPYLHNGSVPTLQDLFSPAYERPTIWGRNTINPKAYNFVKTGLEYDDLTPREFVTQVVIPGTRLKSTNFDDLLNVDISTLSEDEYDARSPEGVNLRRFYRTSQYGRGNQGHEYGTNLSATERSQLIEYLKAISGKHIQSVNPIERYNEKKYPKLR